MGGYSSRLFTDNPLNHGRVKDPDLAKLDALQRLKTNEPERKAVFWDLQRLASQKMYYVPGQWGAGTAWGTYQPWTMNAINFQTKQYGGGTETAPYRWKNK